MGLCFDYSPKKPTFAFKTDMEQELQPLTVVTAAIIMRHGKCLITRRKPEKKMGGYWEFPGGKVEMGETNEQCLQRELHEELSIVAQIGACLASANFAFQGNNYQIVAYEALHLSGDIVLIDHDELAWVQPSDLWHYQLTPADADIVTQLLAADKP